MQKLHETATHEFYRDFYHDGTEIIFYKDKATGELRISAESFAKIMWFKSAAR